MDGATFEMPWMWSLEEHLVRVCFGTIPELSWAMAPKSSFGRDVSWEIALLQALKIQSSNFVWIKKQRLLLIVAMVNQLEERSIWLGSPMLGNLLHLLDSVKDSLVPDYITWALVSQWSFSAISFRSIFSRRGCPTNQKFPIKLVWQLDIPAKVYPFMWGSFSKAIPTTCRLKMAISSISITGILCCANKIDHLLVTYQYASKEWKLFCHKFKHRDNFTDEFSTRDAKWDKVSWSSIDHLLLLVNILL